MLAQAKQGLKFKDEQSDTWVLRPSDSVTTGSALAKDAADAKKYLERVVAEHEGTPWAIGRRARAWRSRSAGNGVKFTDIAGRMARAEAGNNRPRPETPEPAAQTPPRSAGTVICRKCATACGIPDSADRRKSANCRKRSPLVGGKQ